MLLNDKTYNVLKWVALIALPAGGTLYYTLANIWGLPYAEQVVATVVAANTFLGAVLGVSTYQYNKVNSEVSSG